MCRSIALVLDRERRRQGGGSRETLGNFDVTAPGAAHPHPCRCDHRPVSSVEMNPWRKPHATAWARLLTPIFRYAVRIRS